MPPTAGVVVPRAFAIPPSAKLPPNPAAFPMHQHLFRIAFITIACFAAPFAASKSATGAIVTEQFSGVGILVTPGDIGDAGSSSYSITVSQSQIHSTIQYELQILTVGSTPDSSGNTGLHFDGRGFGDTGGNNDALQSNPTQEFLSVVLHSVQVTANAPNVSIVSHNVSRQIEAFHLVNDGNPTPTIAWSDNVGGSGVTVATTGGSGQITIESGLAIGATTLEISAEQHRSWINSVFSSFDGDVIVDVGDASAVPEPSSAMALAVAVACFGFRRRKHC